MSPVAVTNFSFCSDSSIAGLKSDPLTVLVQVIFSSVKPPGRRLTRQFRALSRALKIEKLTAALFYRPNGAELQMTGGTRCITIQTGIFSYRDQLVLKSF